MDIQNTPEAPILKTPEQAPIQPGVGLEQVPGQKVESAPERIVEKAPEKALEKKGESTAPAKAITPAPVIEKTEDYKKIEEILSEGIEDLYKELPENRKAEFRKVGEETTSKIEILLKKAKVQMAKIVSLIRKWLSMIPGVNKFYLEQETKLKADKLIAYKKSKEGEM